jgi:hypothetical protein
MTMQLSIAARNALLDAIETATGVSAKLRLYTGAQPATCATARSGALLAELALPSDWMANASGGTKSLSGSWTGTGAAAGTAAHYAIMDSAGTTCHEQGSVTATGGGGDMTLDNTSIAAAQTITITSKTLTAPNA